jgi:hypothetical protein
MKKPEKTCPPFRAAKEGRQVECDSLSVIENQ